MDYRSLTSLALRLCGVLILVSEIAGMSNTFTSLYWASPNEASPLITALQTLLSSSGALIIGLLLICFPSTVSNKIIKADVIGSEGSVSYRDLQTLAFSVLGLYFVTIGLHDAVYWFARLRLYYQVIQDAFPQAPAMTPLEFSGLTGAALYAAAGLLLIFGAKGISRLVEKIRGVDKNKD